jgi:TDG/mug DNA glycosylase family protein
VTILPDVLADDLDIVFCGSAAGRVSAAQGAYYAGPGNRFWPMLAEAGLTPRRLAPSEFRTLPRYGLGLSDLCQHASGPDAGLPADGDDPAALAAKIERHRPRWLAFVGKRPAKVFLGRAQVATGVQPERPFAATGIFVLPSPSGAARGHWDPAPWHELAALVARSAA